MRRFGFLAGCIILVCGVMWSNLALAQNCPPRKNCKESFVLAKSASANEPVCWEHVDCLRLSNKRCDDCIMRMQWKLTIQTKDTLCDETRELIPDGSTLAADLTYHIRRFGPCGTPVGTHEGKFTITDTAGNVIATGKMKGTNGLETHGEPPECCEEFHDEGCLDGKILIKSPTGKGKCKLIATYSSFINPSTSDVCNRDYWKNLQLFIDGIVQCNCPRPTGHADLIPEPLSGISPTDPMRFCRLDPSSGQLMVRVKNQGTAPAPASTTRVLFSTGDTCVLPTPPIPAGGTVDVGPCNFPIDCHDPDCDFTIGVDVNSDVGESNEGNNIENGLCIG